jgi:hephaestin
VKPSPAGAAIVALALATAALFAPATGAVRTYYIGADDVVWNYAPQGRDLIVGGPLPKLPRLALGWSYHKIIYRQYQDATFARLLTRSPSDAYLGLLGPIIHAEVGDTIVVVFKNNARITTGISASPMLAPRSGPVSPGAERKFVWKVTDRAAPGPDDGSSIAWRYFSPVDENRDENTGMIGAIVVTRRGAAKADGTPADVDREVFTLFAEMDESQSRLIEDNLSDPSINPRHISSKAAPFRFNNETFSIDGFLYGNMPMIVLRKGERVRWYVIVTRSDSDAHLPHWHGQTVLEHQMRTDVVDVQVDQTSAVDMIPDNVGIWLFHCHVQGHLALGMEGRFQVKP